MKKLVLIFFVAAAFVGGFYYFVKNAKSEKTAYDYKQYCGSCHIPPKPEHLTQQLWKENVLPEMGARLGMKTEGYHPYKDLSYEEQYRIKLSGIYPEHPQMSEKKWERLKKYIIDKAPKEADPDKKRPHRNAPLSQFTPQTIALDDKPGGMVTSIGYNPEKGVVNIGDVYGNIFTGTGTSFSKVASISSPVVSVINKDSFDLVTGIGYMPPTEIKSGKIFQLEKNGVAKLLLDTLHRPVFVELQDINGTGPEELIVCEYGNILGQLTLYYRNSPGEDFTSKLLLALPGTLRIVLEDMDGDGKKDLVVLHAQGDEGITILYQKDNFNFQAEKVIRLSPVYGSSWFELIDYDGDGDKDVVLVNGDNADLSFMTKPFHGVRLFINNGGDFTQEFFYPVYGATRVSANDFDEDGDIDFAVCSFFPDYENSPEESFVYLENTDVQKYQFKTYTFEAATKGRWMVMDQGDMDGDGDIDILLGSFIHTPTPTPKKFSEEWQTTNTDLIFLENKLK